MKSLIPNAPLCLLGISLTYPVLLITLTSGQPAPWWLLEPIPSVFLMVGVPLLGGTSVIIAKETGVKVSWLAGATFTVWLGVFGLTFLVLLNAAAASV
jgi:hypothetical protein